MFDGLIVMLIESWIKKHNDVSCEHWLLWIFWSRIHYFIYFSRFYIFFGVTLYFTTSPKILKLSKLFLKAFKIG
jgi:hypothetical protein